MFLSTQACNQSNLAWSSTVLWLQWNRARQGSIFYILPHCSTVVTIVTSSQSLSISSALYLCIYAHVCVPWQAKVQQSWGTQLICSSRDSADTWHGWPGLCPTTPAAHQSFQHVFSTLPCHDQYLYYTCWFGCFWFVVFQNSIQLGIPAWSVLVPG